MKTTILTATILLTTVLGISQPTFASSRNNGKIIRVISPANKISKIEIRGNVELYISDGTADNIKIYNKNYEGAAMVPDQNGVLRISSSQTKKLVVWVTVSDLCSMSVYDNAEVQSFGSLSAIDLDIKLYDNATARLNLDGYHANITLNDHAKAALSGSINQVDLKYDITSFVDTTELASEQLVKTENLDRIASKNL